MKTIENVLLTDNVILNGGDAAILQGTMRVMAPFLSGETIVHCDYFDHAKNRYPEIPLERSLQESVRIFPPQFFWRFSPRKRFNLFSGVMASKQENAAYSAYKAADAVISCGGSFLTDAYNCSDTLFGYDLAIRHDKPLFMIGQTIGPFKSERVKSDVADRLKKFQKLLVRDHHSYLLALEMGCKEENIIEVRDMAFMMDTPLKTTCELDPDKLVIGLSVRKWTYPYTENTSSEKLHDEYIEKFAQLTQSLIDELNAEIIFISTCQGIPEYSFHDDHVAMQVYNRLPATHQCKVKVDTGFYTPDQLVEVLNAVDMFIGTRMHACILSLIKAIPTINICYEFKSRELFNDMGLGEFVHDIDNIEIPRVLKNCRHLIENYDEIQTAIADKVRAYKKINKNAIKEIFS